MNKKLQAVNLISDIGVESQELETATLRKSRIVSRFLSPALKFWLKSQLEQVEELKVQITGGDRQIITGKIPQAYVAAAQIIFRGLHLTEVELSANEIMINIGQIIKGKPLKILKPFPIFGNLKLLQSDFNASLQSPLLAQAIIEFLVPLLPPDFLEDIKQPINLYDQVAEISQGQLNFFVNMLSKFDEKISLTIHSNFKLGSSCELLLENLDLQISQQPTYNFSNQIKIDLGSDVELQELTLDSGQFICRGCLIVKP